MRQLSQQTGKFVLSVSRWHLHWFLPKWEYFNQLFAVTSRAYNSYIFEIFDTNCHNSTAAFYNNLWVQYETIRWLCSVLALFLKLTLSNHLCKLIVFEKCNYLHITIFNKTNKISIDTVLCWHLTANVWLRLNRWFVSGCEYAWWIRGIFWWWLFFRPISSRTVSSAGSRHSNVRANGHSVVSGVLECQSTRHTVNSSQPKIVWRVDQRLKHRVVTSWPAVLSLLWRVDRSLLSV